MKNGIIFTYLVKEWKKKLKNVCFNENETERGGGKKIKRSARTRKGTIL